MNNIAALLYAVAASVLFGIALGFQHGALNPAVAMLSLGGGAIVGMVGWWRGKDAPALPRPRGWAWVPIVIFTLFSLRAFLWLIFREGDELRVLSPNNLGDVSLHITFIRYFANGAPFWPDSPIFSAGKLTYAAGMDLFNSLLALVGVDVFRGLIWTGLLGALATGVALLRWGGAFTMLGFLCNGGLAGFACLFAKNPGLFFRDYQSAWAWKSLPLAILVTQRGFLFALPAGLLLMMSWRTKFFLGGKGWKLPFRGELLLYAALPIFHVHTFLALSFMLAAFFVARAPARLKIAALVGAALIPATVLVYLTVGMFRSNAQPMPRDTALLEELSARPPVEALGWQPGWMVNDDTTASAWSEFAGDSPAAERFANYGRFLFFWFGNFGVLPLLLVPLVLAVLRRKDAADEAWLFVLAAVAITPLLGGWDRYQHESFATLLTGTGSHAIFWFRIVTGIAIVASVAAFLLQKTGIRWVLITVAGLCIADWLLAALHGMDPRIPLLHANAAPLLIATFAFAIFLRRISRRDDDAQWPATAVVSALYLFFLCCNVKFAPWDWDNTKIMLWAYLFVLPFLWELLIARWSPWVREPVCVLLFFSGFISLIGGIDSQYRGYAIAYFSKLDAVAEAVRDIPITATFAARPSYNHPLLLCGRKVVMGFEGHLGSHGIHYSEVSDELDALMNGLPDWRQHATRLGARYLFFGPEEREQWPNAFQAWRDDARLVASGEWGEIFDLDSPPLPARAKPIFR